MTSDNRTQVNRQNAQKSTGPKTPEGKAASSRNALKHGLTAETHPVIPGEEADAYTAELEAWLDRCDDDSAQIALAERACRASWQLRQIARAEDARIATQARSAADNYDLKQFRLAQSLGERLFHDPQNR
jgi:hypothetical protein